MFATRLLFGLVVSALLGVSGLAAEEPKIGVASETKNQVQGIRGAESRPLTTGSEVFLKESVQTGDESVAHLLFLDNTNLSVGPDSLVELDKFVYDPDRKIGQIVVEVGRGAFRFATAQGSSRNYSIRTPYATLGIRGTIFELVQTTDDLKVKLNQGLVQVRTIAGQIVWLTRPNTLVTVFPNGTFSGPIAYDPPLTQFANLNTDPPASNTSTGTSASFLNFLFLGQPTFQRRVRSGPPEPQSSNATLTEGPTDPPDRRLLFSKQMTKSKTEDLPISPTR